MLIFDADDFLTRLVLQPRGVHFAGELPGREMAGVAPMRLAYEGRSHYNSVVPAHTTVPHVAGPPLGESTSAVLRSVCWPVQELSGLYGRVKAGLSVEL